MLLTPLSLALAMLSTAPEAPAPSTGFHWNGGRGLAETRSADALGSGIFLIGLRGAGYTFAHPADGMTPPKDAIVTTMLGSAGMGVNSFIDISAWSSYFTVTKWDDNPNSSGFGASGASAKISIPFRPDFPLRLAVEGGVIAGASTNQIDSSYDPSRQYNRADAYSWFETRMGYDFEGRFLQTLRFGKEFVFEMHANEGIVTTLQDETPALAVIDGGIGLTPWSFLTVGLEGHMRTMLAKPRPFFDPLWGTASTIFHIPNGPDIALGCDVSLSKTRSDTVKPYALQPWRAFMQVAMPFDLGASARAQQKALEDKNAKERADLERRNKELEAMAADLQAKSDSLAAKAKRDSLDAAKQAAQFGLSQEAFRRMLDSLALRAREDSLRRVAAEGALADERSRRSSLEQELLNTGLLALDAVYFQNNKSVLTPNSKPYLKLVGSILAKYPKLKLEVGGHTDNRGKPSANKRLSQMRANAVRSYFVVQYPVLAGCLTAKGYGSDVPIAENSTEKGREQNRRVEIKVTNPDILESIRRGN